MIQTQNSEVNCMRDFIFVGHHPQKHHSISISKQMKITVVWNTSVAVKVVYSRIRSYKPSSLYVNLSLFIFNIHDELIF